MLAFPKSIQLKDGSYLIIKEALTTDAAAIIEMVKSILGSAEFTLTQPDEFTYTIEEEAAILEKYQQNEGHIFLLAEWEGQLIGNLSFTNGNKRRNQHQGELAMGILKVARGKGVGTILLESLLEWAAQHPVITKVKLQVAIQNYNAIHLYRNLGFIEEARYIRDFKTADGEFMDVIGMYKFV